jgi:Golgi apparatus protein 1
MRPTRGWTGSRGGRANPTAQEHPMRTHPQRLALALVASFGFAAGGATAAEDIVASAQEACKAELDSYCKSVSPGGGRILHCLAAHEDKLSGRCVYGLYRASAQLDQFVASFEHVANACMADVKQYCGDVPVGEGRVAQCLKQNEAKASKECQQAMKDTKMEVAPAPKK